MLNNAELASIVSLEGKSLATEADQLVQQLEQTRTLIATYETMIANTIGLPDSFLRQAMEPVQELRGIMAEAGALAQSGSNLDQFLRSGLIDDPLFDKAPLDNANVTGRYDDWLKAWNTATTSSLRAANLTLDDVQSEAQLLDTITQRFGSEKGHMQALQIANELAGSMSRQMNSLRTISAVQAEQTSIAWGRVLAEQDRKEAARRQSQDSLQHSIDELENQKGRARSINEILGIGGDF